MSEFVNWNTLGTYGGALAFVLLVTQFTKDLSFTKKLPTQIWSYILAFITLMLAHIFTDGINPDIISQAMLNAIIISMAANGGYSGLQKMMGKATDGQLLVDVSNEAKDIYRLDVGSLDDLTGKKSITLKVKTVTDLSSKS